MPMLYASRIIAGKFQYNRVPKTCKEQVAEILREADMDHLITE